MLQPGESIELARDVDAFLIPSGTPVTLNQGEEVSLTQVLGGSYTVHIKGNLVRITAANADALGEEIERFKPDTTIIPGLEVTEKQVWAVLATCYDPEIPVSIAELGLIYAVKLELLKNGGYIAHVIMTLTAPGCGMGPVLLQEVEDKLLTIQNVIQTKVELVFDPPWDQSRMSEAAKLQLGML